VRSLSVVPYEGAALAEGVPTAQCSTAAAQRSACRTKRAAGLYEIRWGELFGVLPGSCGPHRTGHPDSTRAA